MMLKAGVPISPCTNIEVTLSSVVIVWFGFKMYLYEPVTPARVNPNDNVLDPVSLFDTVINLVTFGKLNTAGANDDDAGAMDDVTHGSAET